MYSLWISRQTTICGPRSSSSRGFTMAGTTLFSQSRILARRDHCRHSNYWPDGRRRAEKRTGAPVVVRIGAMERQSQPLGRSNRRPTGGADVREEVVPADDLRRLPHRFQTRSADRGEFGELSPTVADSEKPGVTRREVAATYFRRGRLPPLRR
jgi:hypothetical protein